MKDRLTLAFVVGCALLVASCIALTGCGGGDPELEEQPSALGDAVCLQRSDGASAPPYNCVYDVLPPQQAKIGD